MFNIADIKAEFENKAYTESTQAAAAWLSDHLFDLWDQEESLTPFDVMVRIYSSVLIDYSLRRNNKCMQQASDFLKLNRTTLLGMIEKFKIPSKTKIPLIKTENSSKELVRMCKLCRRVFVGKVGKPCPECGNSRKDLIMIKRDLGKIRY